MRIHFKLVSSEETSAPRTVLLPGGDQPQLAQVPVTRLRFEAERPGPASGLEDHKHPIAVLEIEALSSDFDINLSAPVFVVDLRTPRPPAPPASRAPVSGAIPGGERVVREASE